MEIGLASGAKGESVAQLQRILTSGGHAIDRAELDGQQFGATTAAALRALQAERGLPASGTVDAATLAVLQPSLGVPAAPAVPAAGGDTSAIVVLPRGSVQGRLVDGDGMPVAGMSVTLAALRLRGETALGSATTDAAGHYAISYVRPAPQDLVVRAMDATGKTLGTSATLFAAPAAAEIDFTTAPDGILREPSQFSRLGAAAAGGLGALKLEDLKETRDQHELGFLARSTSLAFTDAAHLFLARVLAPRNKLRDETLYGLFASGVPAELDAALADPPEAGLDDAFAAQVLSGVLAQPQAMLAQTLGAAIAANLVPASYAAVLDAQLATLAALRAAKVGATRYIRGKTSLDDLLAAGTVPQAAHVAFVQAFAAAGGRLGPTWKALRANSGLSKADLAQLDTVLSAGELLAGNLPLVKDTLGRLHQNTLARLQDLALLDEADWQRRIAGVDPAAASIPPVLPNEAAADRIARLAKSLARRFAGRYPTTAFAGGLSKAPTSTFKTKTELAAFLTANPKLSIRRSNIDRFIAANRLALSPAAVAELKTAQRLHRVSPHYASVEALHAVGYASAQSVYLKGRAPFLAQMTEPLGGKAKAATAYARSRMIHGTALAALGRYNASFDAASPAAVRLARPDAAAIADLPDIQALFGSLDYFQCEECRSVYGPAAYLVDLLQYLDGFAATPPAGAVPPFSEVKTARDLLLLRRPDIANVALSCSNSGVTIPYIDLVNEVLEAALAPPAVPRPTVIETIGTAASLRALPQQTQPQVAAAAYAATAAAVFPLSLPFDASFARTQAYVAALGVPRARLLHLLPGAGPAAVAGAALGLNPAMRAIVTQANTADPWTRWGLQQVPASVVDPKTGQPYAPAPADWVAALNKVPVLLNRAGLTLPQLYQLLEVVWVTGSAVTLRLGTRVVSGVEVVSSDTDAMTFTGLTGEVLDRANRFLRLWSASGLQMWELDWALTQRGGMLDDGFLAFLSDALAVRQALSLPFQEVLAFWGGIETRNVVSHLGDGNEQIPATYAEIFADPAMAGIWGAVFADPAALSGAPIVYPASADPTPAQLQPLNGIAAALGLGAADISAILAASGAANALTLPTLTALVRHARLAAALSLTIPDLILWIELTDRAPFGGAPADTLEFLRRLDVLRGTGLAAPDLDYLLRGRSASRTALAFTDARCAALLQTIRDAVAKAVATSRLALASVTDATPIGIVTAMPHGLATGQRVFVAGVGGTTAANGLFTVTVTDAASFTLDGSAGNGAWTGGGAATADPDAAIGTLVVAALAEAVQATSDIVSPVLAKSGVLPLGGDAIAAFLAPGAVDAGRLPALVAALTRTAKAAALYGALAPAPDAFAFLVRNAELFRWLDPGALPLAPVDASQYPAFEALLQALALGRRQTGRRPKLFDVLGQWLAPGGLPADARAAIEGAALAVAGASNASPIAVSTTLPHGLGSGAQVTIAGILGNMAANGTFTITVTGPASFTLDGATGSGAWISGGTVTSPDMPSLARALAAGAGDVEALAARLGAGPPSLDPAHQAGTLADIATLARIAEALDVAARFKVGAATLALLAADPPGPDGADAAVAALQARYARDDWYAAVQPVEDKLREARRDALVACLLGSGLAAAPGVGFLTTDDIFAYFLIDPGMCPCGETTRLLQPSLAIQQFVQQCFLNIRIGAAVDTADARWSEWSWRQQYRLWQANRQVFLYPENYLLPELRPDASSFFSDLGAELRQTDCDADAVETAFAGYLRSLVDVSHLVVAAHCNETKADGSRALHVFARTRGTPPSWFYRVRTTRLAGSGVWSPWAPLKLDIPAGHLLPVIWDRRLFLVWPIFEEKSEKPRDQASPTAGGATYPAAKKYWSVSFAMSELSAGQWRPKRVAAEKMFFGKTMPAGFVVDELPPEAFVFRAFQTPQFDLQIDVYWYVNPTWSMVRVATATLSMPDAPLAVAARTAGLLPAPSQVDLAQEPSYARISSRSLTGTLALPASYGYRGQDLAYGAYYTVAPGAVPLNVLCRAGSGGQLVGETLLGSIADPRLVAPQQETSFDSTDPFFVADSQRCYFVQPHYYTVSSAPQEIDDLAYVPQWTTRYAFQSFYHPYARVFLRELEIGGVPRLMSRDLQLGPQAARGWPAAFDFQALYNPAPAVAMPYPGAPNAPDPGETALDFAPGSTGAYSLYNWEVFYHAPMFVASLLLLNQKHQDAIDWLKYIFDPTDGSAGPAPQRFWEMAPFNAMSAADWANQEVQALLTALAAGTQQGVGDPATQNAILAWMADPYDPHRVAATRISAYAKATVMKFLDTLIAWGDSLYAQYTTETVSQAEQLYVLADMILGPRPDRVRRPDAQQGAAPTYASLQSLDLFSNALVSIENVVVAPSPPQGEVQGSESPASLPTLPGAAGALLFCIPPNTQLLAYWDKVAQRLYNIRHCLNLQGVAQPLPLYAPPLDPMLLAEGQAAGAGAAGVSPAAPVYRFATCLQKAIELAQDVRGYGALILSALEKQDAERLSALRATQELDVQTRLLDVKAQQVAEAQAQSAALQNQKAVVQTRYDFYSNISFINAWEAEALALQLNALVLNGDAIALELTAGTAYALPNSNAGIAGPFGTPNVTIVYGGENVGNASSAAARALRGIAGLLAEGAGMVSTMGAFQRRQDEWTLQADLARAELAQIDSQIAAAGERLGIAQKELAIQQTQMANARAVSDFLTGKYTSAQLYAWMAAQLATVHAQAYQLAFGLAQMAQSAYRYELGRPSEQFLQFGYWDSQHKGLTAGESLLLDLRRMEAQYLADNLRELELTKHVSLALTQPMALVQLLQTGSCGIALDESLFDRDHPGHFFRRMRSVALVIPCIAGPFTCVNATLALGSAVVRTAAPGSGYKPWAWATSAPDSDPAISASPPAAVAPIIATSSAQDDAGLFEASLRDERWLPFEGQGAVSTWRLTLDPRDNAFDLSSVTDVVLHLRYTARFGGDAEAVRTALKPDKARSVLVSVRSVFGAAYHRFLHPTDSAATEQTLVLPLTEAIFAYSSQGAPRVTSLSVVVALATPLGPALSAALTGGLEIDADFGPSGGAAPPAAVKLTPVAGTAAGGGPVAALFTGAVAQAPAAPQSVTLTVPAASVPAALGSHAGSQTRLDPDRIDDILLLVGYEID